MALTSLADVRAGSFPPLDILKLVPNNNFTGGLLISAFYADGVPPAAAVPSPGMAGAALTSYAGQIPWTNPVSGHSYLVRAVGSARAAPSSGDPGPIGKMVVFDRLWHNSGIVLTTTTSQTIDSVTWPARDRSGTTDGKDVMVGIEVSSQTGNGGAIANTTLSYTNSAGTSGRTGTLASYPSGARAGTLVFFQLDAGDTGIRSIQSITLGTSYVSGAIHLVACRKILEFVMPLAAEVVEIDAVRGGRPRLFDNSVLFIAGYHLTASAKLQFIGSLQIAQG